VLHVAEAYCAAIQPSKAESASQAVVNGAGSAREPASWEGNGTLSPLEVRPIMRHLVSKWSHQDP
jgi:hypothetical protein